MGCDSKPPWSIPPVAQFRIFIGIISDGELRVLLLFIHNSIAHMKSLAEEFSELSEGIKISWKLAIE